MAFRLTSPSVMRSVGFSHGLRSESPLVDRCAGIVTAGWPTVNGKCAIGEGGID
jgi:hypothetical protein